MSKATVLVVDDNAALRENLAEILIGAGHDVRATDSGERALELVRDGVDVALVDLKLPDQDGTALAGKLKDAWPDCEVILLTGFATVESAAAAVRAGAWAYLVKPVAVPELLTTVEQALRQVRSQSDKRELARRAQVAEKLAAVGTLTAGLSHEIRNPLNAAVLQLSVLERRVRRLEPQLQAALLEPLTLVRDEVRRLDHILEDFLQFARPASFTPVRVALAPLFAQIVAFLRHDAERRGISLDARCSGEFEVLGNDGRLRQALLNLALNALDATPRGGFVRLSCAEASDRTVVVRMDDSGPGIPPDVLPRLFEPFFTTKPTGSGLGLSIVHAIVTQHGGSITAGRCPGAGARFEIVLSRAT